MCTVSWASDSHRTHIFFNRDERHSRKPGNGPKIDTKNGVQFISPTDGDFGGTWIGVNEYGCVFALLNFYPNPIPQLPDNKISRGFIIPTVACATSEELCKNELQNLDHSRFEPFEFLFLDSLLNGFIARWDGNSLSFRNDLDSELPLSSSSFVTSEIVKYRRGYFRKLRKSDAYSSDMELQEHFHFARPHSDKAWNPLMWRPEARTVSISEIEINPNEIQFRYFRIEENQEISKEISTSVLPRKR